MNQELIQLLHQDFTVCKNYLRKVGITIMEEGISKFPIFAAVTETIDLDVGVPIIRHEELGTHYTFNASHLEDFVNKQIVDEQKTTVFIDNFKDPLKYCCIFLSDPSDSSFIFIPYDAETMWEPKNREELN